MTHSRGKRIRFPSTVYAHGIEPDVRFSLANERTFLAWIRTSLAMIAGGVALEVLGPELQETLRAIAVLILVCGGTLLSGVSWFQWMVVEKALRDESVLPSSFSGPIATVISVLAGMLVLLSIIFR